MKWNEVTIYSLISLKVKKSEQTPLDTPHHIDTIYDLKHFLVSPLLDINCAMVIKQKALDGSMSGKVMNKIGDTPK